MIHVKKPKNISVIIIIVSLLILASFGYTVAYLLARTSPIVSIFKPCKYVENNFTISKIVEHSLGEDYIILDNMEFEFQVDLGSYYRNTTIVTSQGEFKTNENGIFNINIKPNSDVEIKNIEEGTKVKVTEIQNKAGFTEKNQGIRELTISTSEENSIEFINVYKPLLVTGENITLKGIKTLEGREWQEGDNFSFILEHLNDNNEWEKLDTKTITYNKENSEFNKFDFTEIMKNLQFKDAKTYKFRVSESVGSLENISYDKTINNFEIVINDKLMDGQLEIQEIKKYQNVKVSKNNNIHNIEVNFNNIYKIEENVEIEYVDKEEHSILVNDNIIVKNYDYGIDTVISRFKGLDNNYTYTVYDKDNNIQNSNLVRTGDYIIIVHNNIEYRYNVVLLGDVSGDGLITPLDYVKIKNHITSEKLLSGKLYELAADASGDNEITPLDYVKVKNYIIKGGN